MGVKRDTESKTTSLIIISFLIFKIVMTLGGFLYLHAKYRHHSRIIKHFQITNPSFRSLGPYNTTKMAESSPKDYATLFNVSDFKFTKNPKTCEDYNPGLLLITIVHSAPNNFAKRAAIRETWGRKFEQYTNTTKVLFLIGTSDDSEVSREIEEENKRFGDFVQGNFEDVYRNMTYKHVMGLKWVVHHCKGAKFVLKVDDDVFINMQYLWRFLAKELSPFGVKDLMLCTVMDHALAVRDKSSAWYVTKEEYPENEYPRYCSGPVVLYSADVVARLLEVCQKAPYFWIDDVQVTGVCAKMIEVVPMDLGSLKLDETRASKLVNEGRKGLGNFITGPFTLQTQRMVELWKGLQKE